MRKWFFFFLAGVGQWYQVLLCNPGWFRTHKWSCLSLWRAGTRGLYHHAWWERLFILCFPNSCCFLVFFQFILFRFEFVPYRFVWTCSGPVPLWEEMLTACPTPSIVPGLFRFSISESFLKNYSLMGRRMNMIKVCYMHVWKYHNKTCHFVQLIYTLIKSEKIL
jgi:hypothetical protein